MFLFHVLIVIILKYISSRNFAKNSGKVEQLPMKIRSVLN